MSTVSGDIANRQDGLGGRGKDEMSEWIKGIKKINDERTKRYNKLVGRVEEDKRDNIVRRVNPKK